MLPCNSAHYFYDTVSKKIVIPWLNMIEIVSNKMSDLNYVRPLILGGFVTTHTKIYSKYLPDSVYLTDTENRRIESIIEEVKGTNNISKISEKSLKRIINNSILLACTELPIVIKENSFEGKKVISSIDEYINYLI